MPSQITHSSIILDCRPLEAFMQSRASHSAHIDYRELFDRIHELPNTDECFIAICNPVNRPDCINFFTDKNYQQVFIIEWDNALLQQLRLIGRLDNQLYQSRNMPTPIALWHPATFIQDFIQEHCDTYNIKSGKGLDLACGSGRDLVYLAKHGWDMQGLDYNEGSLARCKDLALHHH
ncbi:MAG: hypothetical protein KAG18_08275, partial [Sinobacterium sp.]|nr:hypothetical protein [Sinobacterium sp.]